MAVNKTHSEYEKFASKWKRCRDVAAGQDAVHDAGESYLPKLADQTTDDYTSYVQRANFFNATWRTVAGMRGMLFRLPPQVVVPTSVDEYLENVDLKGTPLHVFLQKTVENVLVVGRHGILVDHPVVGAAATLADAKNLNLRPTMCPYTAESIINWKTGLVRNEVVLTQVVLLEDGVKVIDEFSEEVYPRWRVLDLDPTGFYRVRLFVKDAGKEGAFVQEGDDILPTMGSKRLGYIPFYFLGVDDLTPCVDEPPLIDLVDMNLSHYRTTADYEHGCHFTGLPTPWVTGWSADTDASGNPAKSLYIGSTVAWTFPNPDTKVGFLEFTGQGMEVLKANLQMKENQMVVLGARMLEQQKKAAETVEVASLHRAGESSTLAGIAQAISMGVLSALRTFTEWAGASSEGVEFQLNQDFFPTPIDSQMLTSLVSAWQMGGISKQVLFTNLQKRDIIPMDADFEEEEASIQTETPKFMQNLNAPAPEPGDGTDDNLDNEETQV